MIHSHRFAAANTAVAYVNNDQKQLDEAKTFLTNGFISVDIFSASPVDATPGQPDMRRRSEGPQLASTFAVGEEAEQSGNVFPSGRRQACRPRSIERARSFKPDRPCVSMLSSAPGASGTSFPLAQSTRSTSGWN